MYVISFLDTYALNLNSTNVLSFCSKASVTGGPCPHSVSWATGHPGHRKAVLRLDPFEEIATG